MMPVIQVYGQMVRKGAAIHRDDDPPLAFSPGKNFRVARSEREFRRIPNANGVDLQVMTGVVPLDVPEKEPAKMLGPAGSAAAWLTARPSRDGL